MKKILIGLGVVLLVAGTVGIASAMLITYDYSGGGPNGTMVSVTESGVTLDAYGSIDNSPATITWNLNGLGVEGNSSTQVNTPVPAGYGFEEIGFVLPENSTWVSMDIWQLTDGEQAGICGSDDVFNNCTGGVFYLSGVTATNPQTVSLLSLATYDVVSVFAHTPDYYSGFRVASVTIDYQPVPEPGTVLLIGAGLVGLIGYGRKRRKK